MTHSSSHLTHSSKSINNMFGERDKFELEIRAILDMYSLEEALEEMDLSPEEVLSILLNGGHCLLPPYLEIENYE